jgi:hypothetical protein
MNKKEIAQQFTRQILEQKPEKVQQPESQEPAAVQTKPKSALQEEVEAARKLLMEIQILYNKAQDNYKKGLEKRITETAHQLQQLEALAAGITFQIKNDGGQHRTNKAGQQSGRQQMAHQGLPDRSFIGDMLSADHPDSHMADPGLTSNRRRKRKKKRGLSQ